MEKQNIIWIFGDQHRGQALGCAGDPNLSTPNIDRMAEDGLYFPSAVAGFPLCCPFRGSLMTSRYPHECVPGHEFQMPPESKTIAHAFKENGYQTAYFGKWHLDGFKEKTDGRAGLHVVPTERRGGFDTWYGYDNNNMQWDCWVHGGKGDESESIRLPGYETDCMTDMLIDYIKDMSVKPEGERQPFFAALSVQPPHNPYVAPPEWMARHSAGNIQLRENVPNIPRVVERARRELSGYYAMIENLDWNVGRVINALEESGQFFNTHIVFFSDHGDMHGSHGQFLKTTAWEEAIRVPFTIWHGSRYMHTQDLYGNVCGVNQTLINHVDIAPTTLGLCGIDKPEWMQGTDYSSKRIHDRKPDTEPDSAYIQSVVPTGHGDSVDRAWRGIVTNDGWKYVCFESVPWLMFNLNEDPYEMANLALNTKYKAERKRLQDRLAQWISDVGDDFSLPEIDIKKIWSSHY